MEALESKERATKFQDRRSEEKSNNSGDGDQEIGTDDPNTSQMPRKLNQHYSAQQILKMQEFYGKNTHIDDIERKELGQELGLDLLRVKFWFQNQWSQDKKKDNKTLNEQLWEENEKLLVDNGMLKRALGVATRVGLLRTENAFIKDEIHRVTQILEKYRVPGVLLCPLHATGSSATVSDDKGNASG